MEVSCGLDLVSAVDRQTIDSIFLHISVFTMIMGF